MRVLFYTLAVFFLDQATKLAVKGFSIPALGISHQGMEYARSVPVFGNWFNITFIENPNMAFGFQLGGKMFLTLFAAFASVGLLWYLWRHRQERFAVRLALALVLAGALGNMVDRTFYAVAYGYGGWFEGNVVDFFDLDLFTATFGSRAFKFWPIFNIADAAVSIGVVQLLIFSGKSKRVPAQAGEAKAASDTALPAESSAS